MIKSKTQQTYYCWWICQTIIGYWSGRLTGDMEFVHRCQIPSWVEETESQVLFGEETGLQVLAQRRRRVLMEKSLSLTVILKRRQVMEIKCTVKVLQLVNYPIPVLWALASEPKCCSLGRYDERNTKEP